MGGFEAREEEAGGDVEMSEGQEAVVEKKDGELMNVGAGVEDVQRQGSVASGGGHGAGAERAVDAGKASELVEQEKEREKSDGVEQGKKDIANKEFSEQVKEGDSGRWNSAELTLKATPRVEKVRLRDSALSLADTATEPGQTEAENAFRLPQTEGQVDNPASASPEKPAPPSAPEKTAKDSEIENVQMQIDTNTEGGDVNDYRMQTDVNAKYGESTDERTCVDAKEPDHANRMEYEVQKSAPEQAKPESTDRPTKAAPTGVAGPPADVAPGVPERHGSESIAISEASKFQDSEAQQAEEEKNRHQKEKELEEICQREAEEKERQREEKLRVEKERAEKERIERERHDKRRIENVEIIARKAVEVLESDADRRKRAAVSREKGSKGTTELRPDFVTKAAAQKVHRTRVRNGVKVDLDVAER